MPGTLDLDAAASTIARVDPYLFRVFDAGNPLAPTARHNLRDVDVVTIGRGEPESRRVADGDQRTLQLSLVDPRVSSLHAHLRKRPGQWIVEDAGSRNGVFRNGTREPVAVLADGDLLELGQTFFVFRSGLVTAGDEPADLTTATLAALSPGFATLLPGLARDLRRLIDVAR